MLRRIFQPKSIPRSFWTLGGKAKIFIVKDGIVHSVELKLPNPNTVRLVNNELELLTQPVIPIYVPSK